MSRSKPVVLHNVVYDTETRTLFTGESAECDIRFLCPPTTATCVSGVPSRPPYPANLFDVARPTYMMVYYHYCFAHAYLDFTLPLLSILDEVAPDALQKREIRLFVLRDNLFLPLDDSEDQRTQVRRDMDNYLKRKIDFPSGVYKGEMRHLHACISKYPILFEEGAPYRYYRFKTLILGGNLDNQRCIHNHASKYPDRFEGEPEASAEQIRGWMEVARRSFGASLGLPDSPPRAQNPFTIVIGRKENRTFLPPTMTRLELALSEKEGIEFGGVVYLEDLSLREQIRLFQRADIIISPHGSALSHLVWSKPGTRVLEVFLTNERRVGIFPYMCQFLGLQSETYIVNPHACHSSDDSFLVDEAFWPALERFLSNN